jgi:hypothetical protein
MLGKLYQLCQALVSVCILHETLHARKMFDLVGLIYVPNLEKVDPVT